MLFPARLIYQNLENKEGADTPRSETSDDAQNKERLSLKEEAKSLFHRLPTEIVGSSFSQWAGTFEKNKNISDARGAVEWLKNAAKHADKMKTADGLKAQLKASPLLGQASAAYIDQYEQWQKTGAMHDSQSEQKNKAFFDWLKTETQRMPQRAAMRGRFHNFKGRPAANEAVGDLTLRLSSQAQGGFNKEVQGLVDDDTFNKMSLKQQEAYLDALEDAYDKNIDDNHPKVLADRDRLLAHTRMPKSYKEGLKNTESWGGGKTLKEVVSWIQGAGLAELGMLEARWDRAGERIHAKKGLADFYEKQAGKSLLDEKEFWEGGRKERAEYLDSFDQIEKKYDDIQRERQVSNEEMGQIVASEASAELEQSALDRKEMAEQRTRELAEEFKNNAVINQLKKDFCAAQRAQEAEKSGEQAAGLAGDAARMREATIGGAGSFGDTLKGMFGFRPTPEVANGNQPEHAQAANDNQPEQARETSPEEAFLQSDDPVETQALEETLERGMKNTNAVQEIRKQFCLTESARNEDVAELMKLAMRADFIADQKELSSVFANDNNAVGRTLSSNSTFFEKVA